MAQINTNKNSNPEPGRETAGSGAGTAGSRAVAGGAGTQANRARKTDAATDETAALYDALGETTEIQQEHKQRWPGITMRPKRVREWLYLKAVELRKAHPELTLAEAALLAKEELDELTKEAASPGLLKQFAATAPSSESIRPSEVREEVEIAAVRWLAPMRWLLSYLTTRTGRRGPKAGRALVASLFLQMAFARGRPEVSESYDQLAAGHTLLSWAHDYPNGLAYSTVCESLHKMLAAKSARALVHVNLELFRQLAEAKDDKGRLLHPDAGRFCAVDGSLIEAAVDQNPGKDDGHRRIIKGRKHCGADRVVYTNKQGNIVRFCFGYKLMAIVDLATTLPLVWSVVPANASEHKEAARLLRILFEGWPECPMAALVGDAAYDKSIDFAHYLVFRLGVQPIFPRAGTYSKHLPHVETNGVPVCACKQPMLFKDTNGHIYTAKKRAELGIPRGQEAPRLDGRLRWKCRNDRCKTISTCPVDDPRLYTYFHRGGEHKLAYLRSVLLLRRNAVESVFASLKNFGLGGKAANRPGWANDDEMDWLLSAGLTYQTARRLAHQSGLYERALEEGGSLRLLDRCTAEVPAPGPVCGELRDAVEDRQRQLERATEPRTWFDVNGPPAVEELGFAALSMAVQAR
jgi:hypothetical protein